MHHRKIAILTWHERASPAVVQRRGDRGRTIMREGAAQTPCATTNRATRPARERHVASQRRRADATRERMRIDVRNAAARAARRAIDV